MSQRAFDLIHEGRLPFFSKYWTEHLSSSSFSCHEESFTNEFNDTTYLSVNSVYTQKFIGSRAKKKRGDV